MVHSPSCHPNPIHDFFVLLKTTYFEKSLGGFMCIQWKSMGPHCCLAIIVLQNIFCVLQLKRKQTIQHRYTVENKNRLSFCVFLREAYCDKKHMY